MRLHEVEITNFRAIEHLEMTDLPETGVIIVHGNNEAGKSTILDAVHMALTQPSKTRRQDVRRTAPAGRDVGPEVRVKASVGEYTFEVTKRWLKKPEAVMTITAPKYRRVVGEEVDETLAQILGDNLDTELAEMLFMRQGQLTAGAAAAGIPSVATALQLASGTEAAGEADTALMAAVTEEYERYFSAKTGKPKQAHAALEQAAEDARVAFAAAKARVAELDAYVDEVARKEEEIRRAEDELPEAEAEAEQRAAEAAEASRLREHAEQAAAALSQATVTLERAQEDLEAREALGERAAAVEAEASALRAKLAPAREAKEEEAAKVAELTAAREEAKQRRDHARERTRHAAAQRERLRAARTLRELEEQLTRAEEADAEYLRLVESAPQRAVTDEDVRALEKAQAEVTLQRALRDTASAKLEIAAAGAEIVIDGEPARIDGTETVPVFDGTELALGEFTVTYRAAEGAADPHAAVEDAERALKDLLDDLGVDTVDAARATRDAHKDYAAELAAAKRRRADLLDGSDVETLRAERSRLAQRAEELAGGEDDTGAAPDTEDAAEQAAADAEAALAEAEQALDLADAALQPFAERKAAAALISLEATLTSKEDELAAVRAELAAAEAKAPKDVLTGALESARAAVVTANQTADEVAARAAAANPEMAERLASGAVTRVANIKERRAQAENRIAALTGYIEQAVGAAEQADRAEAELEKAKGEWTRANRRAEAAKLLYETMTAYRDAARARYTAPFGEAIRHHAATVFGPDVEFDFGEELDITTRTVDGATVALDDLSGGAKEQLAILTRFAIADLVTGSGETAPVPVVVDDALGATDPDRLGLMNVLFEQVGQKAQVLVLTCNPQRFDRVNAAARYAIDDLKTPLP